MFQKPKTAKRLYLDVIPKTIDQYIEYCKMLRNETDLERIC